jgi:hypothetical protein
MKKEIIEIELTNKELVLDGQDIKPLTELQVQKLYSLIRTVDGFRFGVLETVLYIEVEGDNFKIESSPFDVWGGENNEDGDVWGDGVSYEGNLTELNKMNTYENRFIDSMEIDSNPLSITFEYEVVGGVVSEPTEDTHYGRQILSDDETKKIVNECLTSGHINENETGMISVYDDFTVINGFEKETIMIPR